MEKTLAVLQLCFGAGLCPATANGNGEENLLRGETQEFASVNSVVL